MNDTPVLHFLAGPNGAGKSTFYEVFLSNLDLEFVNADNISAALNISEKEAADAADALRKDFIASRRSFVTETVFSDPAGAKVQMLKDAVESGYHVTLYFVGISGADLSEARVISRVAKGGHDVPSDRLVRRYQQSLLNLKAALAFVPEYYVFDNSFSDDPYRLIVEQRNSQRLIHFAIPDWLKPAIG